MAAPAGTHQVVKSPKVTVEETIGERGRRFTLMCAHCTFSYANSVKTDVQDAARRHRHLHRTGALPIST